MRSAQVKVCGLTSPQNIREIASLRVDRLGFIFAKESERAVDVSLDAGEVIACSLGCERVGVFVNASQSEIESTIERFHLHSVQLHGEEKPERLESLKHAHPTLKIIKAIPADQISRAGDYPAADFFLFDAPGIKRGGSGYQFDWKALDAYDLSTPFILAGGILPTDGEELRTLCRGLPLLAGVDLNSRFESSPGIKDISLIEQFLKGFYG